MVSVDRDAVVPEQLRIFVAGILRSPVRVVDQARPQLRVLALRRMKGPSEPNRPLIHFGQRQRL